MHESKRIESSFYVEGYATTFGKYLLYEYDGYKIYEEIMPNAFDNADMSDIVMQYNHKGRVIARTSNKTLGVEVDSQGLFMYADLSKSNRGIELYNDIKEGLITKMSWAFTVDDLDFLELSEYERLYQIKRIKRIYDVSAVSMPANDNTNIQARLIKLTKPAILKRKLNLLIDIAGKI